MYLLFKLIQKMIHLPHELLTGSAFDTLSMLPPLKLFLFSVSLAKSSITDTCLFDYYRGGADSDMS